MMDESLKNILVKRMQPLKTALIVVDVQNDFCHDQGAFSKRKADLSQAQKILPSLRSLIEKCRKSKVPIIFIRTFHSVWTNSPSWLGRMGGTAEKIPVCRPNSWGAEFYEVKPEEGDYIVTKHRYSAFVGTDLALVLRSRGIETILVTGVVTNVCVETTARDGFNHDFNVVLVEDCCGAFSPDEHAATLKNISQYFGTVANSKAIMEILGS